MWMEPAQACIFLLSPARCSGPRAGMLPQGTSELSRALREEGAALGDVFSFLSSLYFRGKATYAEHFGAKGLSAPGALVITPGHGLCRLGTRLLAADLAAIGRVEVDLANPLFVEPFVRDAALLARSIPSQTEVVLLGSVATPKYVEPLLGIFGARLLFPREFAGRGDMSRGGLLLRATRAGRELDYVALQSAQRRGPRPPRLPRPGMRGGGSG